MSDVLEARPPAVQRPLPLDFAVRRCRRCSRPKSSGSICAGRLPEPVRQEVYDAFVRYHVLCFRDQTADKDEQIAFSEQFGTLERHIARNRGGDNPWVHTVSNLGADGRPSGKVNSTTLAHRQIVPAGAVIGDDPARGDDAARMAAIRVSPICTPPMRR